MVHIVGQKPGETDFMFFNVDKPVGAGTTGAKREDVLLVQFVLKLTGFRDEAPNGNNDQTTANQILTFQSSNLVPALMTADGRVSVAVGRRNGGGHFTIFVMNALLKAQRSEWPLIHKIGGCPGELVDKVRKLI